jgi:hypothetical protein
LKGETKGYEYEEANVIWLHRKVDFCREHLQLQAVLAPGLSEYRAYISGGCRENNHLQAVLGPGLSEYRAYISDGSRENLRLQTVLAPGLSEYRAYI